MKPAPFDYVAPASLEEALQHLSRGAGDATILAGGQTLMPLLALRMSTPAILVDINRVEGLSGVSRADGGIRVAAMTRQNDIVANRLLSEALPVLVEATGHVGHYQTRNRGTVGGSVALGEPAAELPACAVALGATIESRSIRGIRTLPADEFYLGPYATTLEPDELITAIRFPDWPSGAVGVFRKVTRRPGDFALVGIVGALVVDHGKITRAGLAWFGMGPTPMKARQAEQALIGRSAANIDIQSVADAAIADADPFDDHAATSEYRRTVGRRVFARSLGEALKVRQSA